MTATSTAELVDYDDVVARFDPVLGLEVHVELSTATKMFCGCANRFGAEPNTQVCPVCLGLPGSLPVLNQVAVESAMRIGLALNCEIVSWCRFARKNYFYPDMPKNYQISQYDEPIAINGYLDVPLDDGTTWRIDIERAHMEEDTGKLTHLGSDTGRIEGATTSLIDYNRAGVPLIEIVTKPIEGTGERAPEIARAYVTALRDMLRALGVSDVRMDQGSMRCDSNVSLKPKGATEFGTRTETKNVNSLKSVEVAVRYEMRRQAAVLDSGGKVHQETRHFHEDGYTSPGRSKETAEDYRYFPEPDLEPIAPDADFVEKLRESIPEYPWLQRNRIQQEWGISDEVMRDLVNAGAIDLVAATVEQGASSEAARAWWGNFLVQKANEAGVELDGLNITPAQVAAVVVLVDEGKLSNKLARGVIEGVLAGEGEPGEVMKARGLELVRDDSLIQAAVDEALAANPDVAEKIRGGKVAGRGCDRRRRDEGDEGSGRRGARARAGVGGLHLVAAVDAELIAAVERSPAATDAHDRSGWVGMFTSDARVEDPYGSQPHVGHDEIGRFYDTFIAPRQIIFHRDVDVTVGAAVVRDLKLEIVMAPEVGLDVPMHLRYDLRESDGDWMVERLRAHWELPAMVFRCWRHGVKSLPPSLRLVRELLRNQRTRWQRRVSEGFSAARQACEATVATLLDAAVAGDELAARRALCHGAVVSLGEDAPTGARPVRRQRARRPVVQDDRHGRHGQRIGPHPVRTRCGFL